MNEYILKRDNYLRILRSKANLCCNKCGKELEIGDNVKSKQSHKSTKLYHSRCFDEMYIDLDE